MEWEEIVDKALRLKTLARELSEYAAGEPCLRANAESIYAHARLLCNELALDVDAVAEQQ